MTELAEEPERISLLRNIIMRSIARPHAVLLVMADRRSLLEALAKLFPQDSGLLMGGTTKADFDRVAATKRILLGTYAVVGEGFDCKRVNELLLATPRSSVKQSIGRIFRQTHAEPPVIYDIEDGLQVYKAQLRKRIAIYEAEIADVVIRYL